MSNHSDQSNNPFFKVDDVFKDQRKQLKDVEKEAIEFQRLCFETFHMNKDGLALYEIIKERYLFRALFAPTMPNPSELSLYYEGFKEALRGLWTQGDIHRRRINGEIRNAE